MGGFSYANSVAIKELWVDRQFREQMIFTLRGDALVFVSTLPPETRENTAKLIHAMQQRFGHCLLAETHRANLYNVRKFSKEPMQEYSVRINKLMSKAYPGMQGTEIYNNLAIEHLLRGLPDQRLAYEILVRKPRDLTDAVDMITRHEACKQYTSKPTGIRMVEEQPSESD